MRARFLIPAMAAVLLAPALAAGCGGDDDGETTVVETTTVTQTVPAPTEPDPDATTPADGPGETGDDRGTEGDDETGDHSAGGGDGSATAPSGGCGRVAFQPNTDFGASGIEGVGVSCDIARAVARAARDHGDSLSYTTRGFRCDGVRRADRPLARVEWVCLKGDDALVRFQTN